MESQKQPPTVQAKDEEKTHIDAGDLSTPPSTDQAEAGPQQQHGPEVVYPKRVARILILTSLCLSVCKQPLPTTVPALARGTPCCLADN